MNAYNNFYLPKDLTGSAANNLVVGEVQTIKLGQKRLLIPNYISFYSTSLQLQDITTSTNPIQLVATQYELVEMDSENTALSGQEIKRGIIITDPTVGTKISLTYQALGGETNTNGTILTQAVNALTAEKPIPWTSILDKPTEYPPADHLTDAKNVYGFEYITGSLNRLLSAIKNSKTYTQQFLVSVMTSFQSKVNTYLTTYNSNQELGFSPLIAKLYQMTINVYGNIPALQQYVKQTTVSLPLQMTTLKTALSSADSLLLDYKYFYQNFEVCSALTTYINSNATWNYNDIYSYLITPPVAVIKPKLGDNYSAPITDTINPSVSWTANVFTPAIKSDSNGHVYFVLENNFGLLNNLTTVSNKYSIIVLGQFNKFVGNVSNDEAFYIDEKSGTGLSVVKVNNNDSFSSVLAEAVIPTQVDYTATNVTSANLLPSDSLTMFCTTIDHENGIYNSYSSKNLLGVTNTNTSLNSSTMTLYTDPTFNTAFNLNQVGLPNSELQDAMTGKLYSVLIFDRVVSMIEVNTLYQFYKKYYGLTNVTKSPTDNTSVSKTYTPSLISG